VNCSKEDWNLKKIKRSECIMKRPSNKVLMGMITLIVLVPAVILVIYTQGCELMVGGFDPNLKNGVNVAAFGEEPD
jgi:hypothetical protein